MEILKANIDDLNEILDLIHESFISEAENMNNYDIQPLRETYDEIKSKYDLGIILKACEDNKIIGSIRAYKENNTCFIEKLAVHPDYRGNGYSHLLINEIINLFSDCDDFEVYTSAESDLNLNLYKNHDFKEYKRESIDGSEFVFFNRKN